MSNWLILHNNSRFSRILKNVLGRGALDIHVNDLVNHVSVRAQMDQGVSHHWSLGGKVVDDFYQRIIFQEVFFDMDSALSRFAKEDKKYVKFSWQAYLLGLFSYSKIVINPVTPNNLSVSFYQFPRQLSLASQVGFMVPKYEIGGGNKPGYMALDTLWYWPDQKCEGVGLLNIEQIEGKEELIRFVRYDKGYIVCWPKVPEDVEMRLLALCNQFGVYAGEAYFRVNTEWVFYSIRPLIKTEGCGDQMLFDIAECVRDIGNEGII